jgi:hypothetical protein
MTNWTGDDGWPVEFPEKLVNAFRKIPNGENLTNDKIHRMAKIIGVIAEGGEIEELPRNRTASVDGSAGELRKFQDYCKRLADQIETLRRPSVLALSDEGVAVFDLYIRKSTPSRRNCTVRLWKA